MIDNDENTKYLTLKELSIKTGCTVGNLRRLCRDKKIGHIKESDQIGYKFRLIDWAEYVAKYRSEAK